MKFSLFSITQVKQIESEFFGDCSGFFIEACNWIDHERNHDKLAITVSGNQKFEVGVGFRSLSIRSNKSCPMADTIRFHKFFNLTVGIKIMLRTVTRNIKKYSSCYVWRKNIYKLHREIEAQPLPVYEYIQVPNINYEQVLF